MDDAWCYLGSANLTGAGMGAKSTRRRNVECGIVTADPSLVRQAMAQFDAIWMGAHCPACGRKPHCAEFGDMPS